MGCSHSESSLKQHSVNRLLGPLFLIACTSPLPSCYDEGEAIGYGTEAGQFNSSLRFSVNGRGFWSLGLHLADAPS